MKRRSFLAAVAPIVALAAPSFAQTGAPGGRLAPTGKPAEAAAGAAEKAPGKPGKGKGPTEITAKEGMLDNKANLAVFSGEVVVKSPEYDVNCDKLTIYLRPDDEPAAPKVEAKPIGADDAPADKKGKGENNSRIDKAVAEGNVKILQIKPAAGGGKPEKYYGSGKKAVFDNKKQTITLTGWPRVQQSVGGSLNKEIVPLEEGVVIVMTSDKIEAIQGRTTWRLIDSSSLEGPKEEKP